LHPHKDLKNITLEEAWTKIKPNVSYFSVFSSEALSHIPDEKRKYLQPKSKKCIFVGYHEYVKSIYFFNLIPIKLLLGEMLSLMKIPHPVSIIQPLFHI
jgi:hypothetical protein